MKAHLLAIAIAAIAVPLAAQDTNPKPAAPPAKVVLDAKEVSADEAEKLIAGNKDIIILDVRTPEEYDHEHIKGAVNVNVFDQEFAKSVAALDQSKPVIIHCASGRRSAQALKTLSGKVTFKTVYHLTDGFTGWKEAGKPFESKPLPTQSKKGDAK